MRVLSDLAILYRQRRGFDLCQLAGFAMIGVALTIYVRPASLALVWINQLYSVSVSPLFWAAGFLVCGWILAWRQHASVRAFFLLTLPILAYATAQLIFALTNEDASATPGYLASLLFLLLQRDHARQEIVSAWMRK